MAGIGGTDSLPEVPVGPGPAAPATVLDAGVCPVYSPDGSWTIIGYVKREAVMIGGSPDRNAIANLILENGIWQLPVIDSAISSRLAETNRLLQGILDILKGQ